LGGLLISRQETVKINIERTCSKREIRGHHAAGENTSGSSRQEEKSGSASRTPEIEENRPSEPGDNRRGASTEKNVLGEIGVFIRRGGQGKDVNFLGELYTGAGQPYALTQKGNCSGEGFGGSSSLARGILIGEKARIDDGSAQVLRS